MGGPLYGEASSTRPEEASSTRPEEAVLRVDTWVEGADGPADEATGNIRAHVRDQGVREALGVGAGERQGRSPGSQVVFHEHPKVYHGADAGRQESCILSLRKDAAAAQRSARAGS